jgi:uncharacterized protein (TIGR00369 family)
MDAQFVEDTIIVALPLAGDLGLKVLEVGDGKSLLTLPFHEKMTRPGGTIMGPVLMTLADAAMYAAIFGVLGPVEMAVTANLNINFLRRPGPKALIAKGKIMKMGQQLAFCDVELYLEGEEEMVAHVTGSYSIPPKKD